MTSAARAARGRPSTDRRRAAVPVAAAAPVARVVVDIPLAHLDHPFDYLVPAASDAAAVPGCRVRLRFAGQLVDGYLLERRQATDHPGRLAPLNRVVSAEPVLTPGLVALARAVADRYAGTLADVLRLAIPPRHARAEATPRSSAAAPVPAAGPGAASDRAPTRPTDPPPERPRAPDPGSPSWGRYAGGREFLSELRGGGSPRTVWTALPGPGWLAELAAAAAATVASGRTALLVVPDGRDAARVEAALSAAEVRPLVLTAELGPAERYRRWLAARRGEAAVVVGTRAAAFAPLPRLGLAAVWDDGDDLHAEPRAPYPHVREVLALRGHLEGAAVLVGGLIRTAEGAALLRTRWARPVIAQRPTVRLLAPRIAAAGADAELARDPAGRAARLPSLAWSTARDGLRHGPVLVQVPRRGYLTALACADCRTPARCPHCSGSLALSTGTGVPGCRWCGRPAAGLQCPGCGSTRLRAGIVGARRTAEELGRAFPGVPVRTSGGGAVSGTVPDSPALVVATPGAEPVAPAGYTAALLLDGWLLLTRPDLRAAEETLRRWMAAAALVRPAGRGGRVVVMAESTVRPTQALIRWDPAGFADAELAERTELQFPPATRLAAVTGEPAAVADLLELAALPASASRLGPVAVAAGGEEGAIERVLLRVPRRDGALLAGALKGAMGVRTARKAAGAVRIQLDPRDIG